MSSYESFARVYDEFMDQTPYESWAFKLESLFKRYKGEEKYSILDLGCGTGKLTRLLAENGHDVIGVDGSQEMLEIASNHEDNEILYIQQDMRELLLAQKVDIVVSVCDCMNYLITVEDLKTACQRIRHSLTEDGLFLFDMNTKYKYETLLADHTFAEDREDCSFIWDNFYDPEDGINEYQLSLFIKKHDTLYEKFEEVHFQKAYDMDTVKKVLEASGFFVEEILDVETMQEVQQDSERVYFIAKVKR